MKVRLPYLVQDQLTAATGGFEPIEAFEWTDDRERFLDGPISSRVAVLDFAEDGQLRPPVAFKRSESGRTAGYDVPRDPSDRSFQAVSVFAAVLRTLRAFEDSDVLGRRVSWAGEGRQLLVVPRAGRWANAFYERASNSLQFFYFPAGARTAQAGTTIYTALSNDIVAHETGHAILDAIAPDLHDAITPQSRSLHEAIADLTALTMSLESRTLRQVVLDQTGGSIEEPTALSAVAEEFGRASGNQAYLRSVRNRKTLTPGNAYSVHRNDRYGMCEVLSGAFWDLLASTYNRLWHKASEGPSPELAKAGRALVTASRILRRLAFRGLDYLPPGDITFADYGRAALAADEAANPEHPGPRNQLARYFVERGIVGSPSELRRKVPTSPAFAEIDLDSLVDDDWLAYDFANRHRRLLRIPGGVPFRVLPRLVVNKVTYRGDEGEVPYRELLFKVGWEHVEPNDIGRGFPSRRAIRLGTTVAVDPADGTIRAVVSTSRSNSVVDPTLHEDRSAFLNELLDNDYVEGLTGRGTGDTLRLAGGALPLHMGCEPEYG